MKRPLLKTILASAAAVAVLSCIYFGMKLFGPAKSQGEWKILSGNLQEVAPPGKDLPAGVRLLAKEESTLERGGIRIVLAADSLLVVPHPPHGEPEAPVLPLLDRGSMIVMAGGPLLAGDRLLVPRGTAEISVLPEEMEVLKGWVEIQGEVFGQGRIIPLPHRGILSGDEPGSGPAPEPPAPEKPEAPREAAPTGRVVDARSGAPLSGVQVRATFSLSDDGFPPSPEGESQVAAATDSAGRFEVPPFHPEDPRLKLHLEVDHPDFLPEVLVIEGGEDLQAPFPFVTISLRRALTCRVLLLDPGGLPLAGAAVEVDDRPVDSFLGEDAWDEGRTFRPRRPTIRYTREDGTIRLWQEAVSLSLRHPFLHLLDLSPHEVLADQDLAQRLPAPVSTFDLDLRPPAVRRSLPDPRAEILTGYLAPKRYRIQDRDKRELADSLVEIEIEGLPTVRLFTDPTGGLTFTPRPYAPWESDLPLSPDHPRTGILTVLSPLLWKQKIPVSFPSRADLFVSEGRLGGQLALRVLEFAGEEEPRTISAEGIRIAEDLTLVRRTAQGEAFYEGPLPRSGTDLEVSLRGYLPERIRVPPHVAGAPFLDLGDVTLRRGGVLPLKVTGGNPAVYQEARFHIADRERPDSSQEYRLDRDGRALVGGLEAARTYLYAVDGSRIERVEGTFFARRELFEAGLSIPLVSLEEAEVLFSGRVDGVKPEQCSSYRVVERYFTGDEKDPLTSSSYPLAPDGLLGSLRILPLPRRAEVFVVGPGHRAGRAARNLLPGRLDLDLGRIVLQESYHAIFGFVVKGLGKVFPPRDLSLFAEEDRNHEIARLRILDRLLSIDHLRPGRYTLRWGGKGEEEEMVPFAVKAGEVEIRAEIPRKPLEREVVEFGATDSEGKPVEGARIASGLTDLKEPEGLPGGLYRVELKTRVENRLRIDAEGFLPAELILPVGAAVPDPVVLRMGARARAMLLEADGRRFEGSLSISFQEEARGQDEGRDPRRDLPGGKTGGELPPLEGTTIHGEPFTVPVIHGKLESARFPPGLQRITFRSASSEAKAEGVFDLAEKRVNDLGTLVLAETRTLSGTVLLPDGGPAAEAVVVLARPGDHYRFPRRESDPRKVLFSAKASPLGRFRIDGLPLDLRGKMVLAAHLGGWTDAVESPVDLSAQMHELVLMENTRLTLDAGQEEAEGFEDHEFRLEYSESPADRAESIDLGPLAPGPRGGRTYEGITPGVYRVLFGLKESHPSFAPRTAAAAVAPGAPAVLRLRVNDRKIAGEAFLNGEPLELGWIILLPDPGKPGEIEFGRVRGGAFQLPVPVRAESAHAALIPQREPLVSPDFSRGEVLPWEIRDFRSAVRRKFLSVHYQAYDLTLELPADFLARNPGAWIEFPHYVWSGGEYRKEILRESLERVPFRLHLLSPGHFSLRVCGRGWFRFFPDIEIVKDTTVTLGN